MLLIKIDISKASLCILYDRRLPDISKDVSITNRIRYMEFDSITQETKAVFFFNLTQSKETQTVLFIIFIIWG